MILSASRRWLAWATLAAVTLGCQGLTASATSRHRLMVMLPSDAADSAVRDRFLRGYSIGASSVESCGARMPSVAWQHIASNQVPQTLLRQADGLQLLVAPPSADLRAFAALSTKHDLTVVLPYQRGSSLNTLRAIEGRQRLWPLVPSHRDDVQATVSAALKAGWGRAMVVEAPGALESTVTEQFVDLYQRAGGHVESYETTRVQRVDPDNRSRFNRFRNDMNWSSTDTVVVADRPDGPLASLLREEQRQGAFGGGAPRSPNWVWLSAPEALASLPEVTWQQIGLQQQARGNHWSAFRASYREHWGGDPDLLAAAGYDTARLLALVDAAPPPKTSEGRIDPLGWIDPNEPAVSFCTALQRRQRGQSLRLLAAASEAGFRAGTTPSGEATAGLLQRGSSGRMVAGLNRTDAATE